MIEKTEILWAPAGKNLPSLGSMSLVDVTDGDTPNIRMPIRMLSIDTPEVTAQSSEGAAKADEKFDQLTTWIKNGTAPVSKEFRDYILPKLEYSTPGTLQYNQGKRASAHHNDLAEKKLARPGPENRRNLFIRSPEVPFDSCGRLLAYVAPSYSREERQMMTRKDRATFNLLMVKSGWAAPFIIFPNIPGELDLPLYLEAAVEAEISGKGQYETILSIPGYEYRMLERLYTISKKLDSGERISYPDQLRWRARYCADMRNRKLWGPEKYYNIPPAYRIWIWPDDVQKAIGMLNLVPALI